jgi:sec-independent protein translocase protein TatB
MLFDIGWPELMLIGAVALVVIGPKDLPRALRVAGYWVRKARTLSREFQSSIDEMIREAELDEMRQNLKKATEFDLEKEFQKTVDPTGELAQSIKPPDIPDFFDETPSGTAVKTEAGPASYSSPEQTPAEPAEEQLALPLPAGDEMQAPPHAAPSPEPVPVPVVHEPPKP